MYTSIKKLVLGSLLCSSLAITAQAQDLISTVGGTLYANTDWYYYRNGGDTKEYSGRLVDNNTATKWFLYNPDDFSTLPLQATFKFNTASVVAQYTITSANDAAERDPKTWTLQGSNDSTAWTILDTRTNETFTGRILTKIYDVATTGTYLYYRLNITATNGTSHFQCAEWRLVGPAPPNAPTGLAGIATSGDEINLTWTDNSANENSFVIERSIDGTNFTEIGNVPVNTTSYTDNAGLLINTLYYYRVKAVSTTLGGSTYATTNLTTLNLSGAITDITDDGGALSVSVENSGGVTANEGSLKLIDNNYSTKYLAFGNVPLGGYWALYKAKYSYVVTSYTITTANDAAGRDPKAWQFQGSNDSTNWNVLDTRANISTPLRGTKYKYSFTNTTAYTYYRLLVSEKNGSTDGVMTQIGEWEIWGMNAAAPKVPTSLDITTTTFNTVSLKWTDNSSNESSFQIERSEDNIAFSAAGTAAANATTYTDVNLYGGTLYYYRVRALSSTAGASVPSNVDTTTTLWDPNLPFSPRNLKATGISTSEISLVWEDKSANETGFKIERSFDGVAFAQIATVGADVTTYTNNGLIKASKYFYRVIAYNGSGTSYYSNLTSAITQGINTAPVFTAVRDTIACTKAFAYKVLFTGISAGTAESNQKVTMGAVSSNATLFATLSFSPVSNDSAWLTFQAAGEVKDSAVITVTAMDDGGTYNSGTDKFTRTFKIVYNPLTIAIASLEGVAIAPYQTAHLTAWGDRVTDYRWTDTVGIVSGSLTTNKLEVRPSYHTMYTVTGTNKQGCAVSSSITIGFSGNVMPNPVNVITPNGDGKNDKWIIWNINRYPDNTVTVFDRAGRRVFFKKNYFNDWDGTYNGRALEEGSYLYVITLGPGLDPVKGVVVIIRDHK
jgi:gliding motility-associated-like protein